MKIVCAAASQIPSDTANSIQVMKVCQAFVQLGHEVALLVLGSKPNNIDGETLKKHYGLTVDFAIEWLPSPTRRRFLWDAAQRAKTLHADLYYCWPLQSAVLGLLRGLPTMVELHDTPPSFRGRAWMYFWLGLFILIPVQRRLLPITRALRDRIHLPHRLTRIAPDGVDLERYDALPEPERARRQLGLKEGMTVLCTGHLYEGRGMALFLSLAARFPRVNFVWVGGRPDEVRTWSARAVNVSPDNVTITGFIPNERIPLYQAAAEVLLMPYERTITTSSGGNTAEVCSPMKMFEYMAAGRAILSSDLPVLHEVLDESMAVFCPPEDQSAWEDSLCMLLENPQQRKALGEKARQSVREYSWVVRARNILREFTEN